MSLTSYRTAPPRAVCVLSEVWCASIRPGDDLLSHVLRRSTIGAEGFHGRVRDGIGWGTLAMATRPERCAVGVFSGERWLIKPFERLVPVSFTCCHASTPGLSTWWSSTVLMRDLVSRGASRLDAFSGYPVRT